MSTNLMPAIREIAASVGGDGTRLLDVAREVQARCGCVSPEATEAIAAELGVPPVDVRSLVSFYAFLSEEPKGQVVIRLCDDVPDRMLGFEHVAQAFREELGIDFGETTSDGRFTLERTACIGMSDQAPAALVNDVVVTELSSDKAREIVARLREHMDPRRLVKKLGNGNNADELVRAMVRNNVHRAGPVVITEANRGEALRKAAAMSPVEVVRATKTARLRGRGGAGFPTGMKWEFTRAAPGDRKFVICNADEGEPGTFKDRVLLTELPDRVFAGMTIAGYAIGAREGILYLRAEYAYLRKFLESRLQRRRKEGLLGKDIVGKAGFDFDVRIQMGAGSYVCGEETALISSCEGLRGDPRNRPPFPAQSGYLGCPTCVNNVETLACVTQIIEAGPATFCEHGTPASTGTKLLSISGDVRRPGVYEVSFGTTLREILALADGESAIAVLVGGPSGRMLGPAEFERTLCYDDLATGGALVVFGRRRDPIEIALRYTEFFEHESCGYCTPCRVGTVLLRRGLERVLGGRGEPADLEQFEALGRTMKATSRCGLGQTAANPVLSTLATFRPSFEDLVRAGPDGRRRSFDLAASTEEARRLRAGAAHES